MDDRTLATEPEETIDGTCRRPVVVFDTDCVLCSDVVAFILAHERDRNLCFAGAWSREGLELAARHGFTKSDLNETFLVIVEGRALAKSDAGIAILRSLKAPWRWLAVLRLVPRGLRDAAYSSVARRRYRWFGRRKDCVVVPRGERHRFLGVGPSADP